MIATMNESFADINNYAVDMLRAGHYNDAFSIFQRALHGLHKLSESQEIATTTTSSLEHHDYRERNEYFMHNDDHPYTNTRQQDSPIAAATTTKIIFTPLPSSSSSQSSVKHENEAFTVFRHAAMIQEAGDVVNCEFERRLFCAIVAYNMGLAFQTTTYRGYYAEHHQESPVSKARKFYSSAGRLLFQRNEQQQDHCNTCFPYMKSKKECDTSIHCLEVAILNNMGQLLYEDSSDYAGARSCVQQIRVILKQRRPCVIGFDLGSFWLNACMIENLTTAPIA